MTVPNNAVENQCECCFDLYVTATARNICSAIKVLGSFLASSWVECVCCSEGTTYSGLGAYIQPYNAYTNLVLVLNVIGQ